jgi:hypothetical protein
MPFDLAHIGLMTTVLESIATSIGAGMLMGGFAFGATRFLRGWARRDLEKRALTDGYIGGFVATGLLVVDLAVRYIV